MAARQTAEGRFEAKVLRIPGGCWLWQGALNKDGYGSFWDGTWRGDDHRNGPVTWLAHRWAYAHFVGKIPEGLNVLHTCDEPRCVRPDHLFGGTQADNVKDCAAKGRRNQTRYLKLDAEKHREIRERYAQGDVSQNDLAVEYGVSQPAVSAIIQRTPGHVPMDRQERGRRRHALAEHERSIG